MRRLILFLSIAVVASAQPATTGDAVPTRDDHAAIIKAGVRLHDIGDFDGAIGKYLEVLDQNPRDALALSELSFSYFAKGDMRKCLDTARRGAALNSRYRAGFFVPMGNALDQMGRPEEALAAYRQGIEIAPNDFRLHYNLGIAQQRLHQDAEATKSYKRALVANPNHPSSTLRLAELYRSGHNDMPALLALLRFLTVEPNSQRSPAVLETITQILNSRVQKGKPGKKGKDQINIFLTPDASKDEGDFGGIEAMLAITLASRWLPNGKDKPVAGFLSECFTGLFTSMGEADSKDKATGFAYQWFVPYFSELQRSGHVAAFTYHILRGTATPDVKQWLAQHQEEVHAFLAWSGTYKWPALRIE